jgi:hypothetical protein
LPCLRCTLHALLHPLSLVSSRHKITKENILLLAFPILYFKCYWGNEEPKGLEKEPTSDYLVYETKYNNMG